ncbi:MarR family winged helix-turn-helix transcriptional regulator [Spirochaeta thermophila]|uniref:HTH marR-type domain-containing protein n=1 Tax=Winmispira thermophila (strain ATCC 49972 / DSM 6192 / RI 19.B1) TaxID=665571 RepID=E0RQY8_WINT6|nr:MarR family transcriptional regulator [Spirochaeta thermophila]ADN01566.1 hypothetical protein STHERM_c06070 [Spirochaeta thermophila DSM 6192]
MIEELSSAFEDLMFLKRKVFRSLLAEEGVYPGQPGILFHLFHHPHTDQKGIAEALGITPASATVMLRRMEQAGLITRARDPHDRRRILVSLTPDGRIKVERLKEKIGSFHRTMFSVLTPEEQEACTAIFRRIADHLSRTFGIHHKE